MSAAQHTDPLERRRNAARRLLVLEDLETGTMQVFACKRVDTLTLLDVGWAEIVGEDYLSSIQEEFLTKAELDLRLAGTPPDQHERVKAEQAEKERAATMRTITHILSDKERAANLLARCDAWLCASVEGIGIGKEGLKVGPLPEGTPPIEVCEQLPNGDYVRKVEIIGPNKAYGPDRLYVTDMWEDERLILGLMVQAVFSRVARVRPLRG